MTDHAEAFAFTFRGVTLAQDIEDFPREVPDTVGQRDRRIKKSAQEGAGRLPQRNQICCEGIFSNPWCAANAIRLLTLYKDSIRAGVGKSVREIDRVWPFRGKTCSRFFRCCLLTVNLQERRFISTSRAESGGKGFACLDWIRGQLDVVTARYGLDRTRETLVQKLAEYRTASIVCEEMHEGEGPSCEARETLLLILQLLPHAFL